MEETKTDSFLMELHDKFVNYSGGTANCVIIKNGTCVYVAAEDADEMREEVMSIIEDNISRELETAVTDIDDSVYVVTYGDDFHTVVTGELEYQTSDIERIGRKRIFDDLDDPQPVIYSVKGDITRIDLPSEKKRETPQKEHQKETAPQPEWKSSYQAGDEVAHKLFGKGKVLSVSLKRRDAMLEVDFGEKGVKKLMESAAPMTKL